MKILDGSIERHLLKGCEDGDIHKVRYYLDRGAYTNCYLELFSMIYYPLGEAIINNHKDIVKLLIAHGANVDGLSYKYVDLPTVKGYADMIYIQYYIYNLKPLKIALDNFSKYDNIEILEILLKNNADPTFTYPKTDTLEVLETITNENFINKELRERYPIKNMKDLDKFFPYSNMNLEDIAVSRKLYQAAALLRKYISSFNKGRVI